MNAPQKKYNTDPYKGREIFRLEVGEPLQKALVNNFEAQKQLQEIIKTHYIAKEEVMERIEGMKKEKLKRVDASFKNEGTKMDKIKQRVFNNGFNQALDDILSSLSNNKE